MKKGKRSIVLLMMGTLLSASLASCNEVATDDYGIPVDKSGPELLGILHDRMMDTHQKYIKYTQVNSYLNDPSTDEAPEDSSKNVLFYTGRRVKKGTSSTREHVWACANSSNMWTHNTSDGSHYVDGSGYAGGGSDLYHIRPCTYSINEYRGNGKFYEFKESDTYYEHGDNGLYVMKTDKKETYATKVEPADEFKGDIARILMYVYVHYSSKLGHNTELSATQKSYLGDLNLRSVFNSGYSLDDIYELMVSWNNLDPVDEMEKKRNDTVEQIQGNRNPFVDHPEYMARCFNVDE